MQSAGPTAAAAADARLPLERQQKSKWENHLCPDRKGEGWKLQKTVKYKGQTKKSRQQHLSFGLSSLTFSAWIMIPVVAVVVSTAANLWHSMQHCAVEKKQVTFLLNLYVLGKSKKREREGVDQSHY